MYCNMEIDKADTIDIVKTMIAKDLDKLYSINIQIDVIY